MMGAYSTENGNIFRGKEISLGKKCVHGMFILSFKKTYKKIPNKKYVIRRGGYKCKARFFAKIFLRRTLAF